MSLSPGDCCRIVDGKLHVAIKALPGASKTAFSAMREGLLWVRLAAAPEDGRANAELIAFTAKILGCPRREVTLARGEKSRYKTLALPLAYRLQLENIIEHIIKEKEP